MKKIKIIILIAIIFLSSGCTAKYSLTIDEGVLLSENLIVSEKLSFLKNEIVPNISDSLDNQFVDCSNLAVYECNEKVYDIEKELLLENYVNNQIGMFLPDYIITYKDEVKFGTILSNRKDYQNEYYNVSYVNPIYLNNLNNSILLSISSNSTITNNNSKTNISINSIDEKIFNEIDNLEINISTVYHGISNNANKVIKDNNQYNYIWNYTKDNIKDANISLVLDTSITIEKKNKVIDNTIILIIIGGIVLFGLIIWLFLKKRSNRVNKI